MLTLGSRIGEFSFSFLSFSGISSKGPGEGREDICAELASIRICFAEKWWRPLSS
jgi:hypothetical protein